MAEQVKLLGKKLRGILPGKAQFNLLDEYTPRVLSTGGGKILPQTLQFPP